MCPIFVLFAFTPKVSGRKEMEIARQVCDMRKKAATTTNALESAEFSFWFRREN